MGLPVAWGMANDTAIPIWAGVCVLAFHFGGFLGLGIALIVVGIVQAVLDEVG